MGEQTSIILHPPRNHLAILREDYLKICEGDTCAALLLNAFEFWTNVLLSSSPKEEPWIKRTQQQISQEDLLGLFERKRVNRGIQTLLKWGFLATRRANENSTDRTQEYLLEVEEVQNCIYAAYPAIVPGGDNAKSLAGTMQSPKRDFGPLLNSTPENDQEPAPLSNVPFGTMQSPFRDNVYDIESPEDPERFTPPTPSRGSARACVKTFDPDDVDEAEWTYPEAHVSEWATPTPASPTPEAATAASPSQPPAGAVPVRKSSYLTEFPQHDQELTLLRQAGLTLHQAEQIIRAYGADRIPDLIQSILNSNVKAGWNMALRGNWVISGNGSSETTAAAARVCPICQITNEEGCVHDLS